MRIIAFTLLSFFLFSFPALAQDAMQPRGVLPDTALPDPTDKQIDEALQVSLSCKATPYMSSYYDCDCTGMEFLKLRQKKGDKANATILLIEAQKQCPNTADVAGISLYQCESWAKFSMPYTYSKFCSCFAKEFATTYGNNTTENEMVRENQMTSAYSKCDGGDNLNNRLAKQGLIQKLKDTKVYKILFPGAVE